VIAATALHLKIPIITDDPHFDLIDGVKTRWPVR